MSPLHAGAESPHPVRVAMSDAAGPSFDTKDASARDALGKEAESFDMVTARPHRPDETLWCEFVELLDCHATFALDDPEGWIWHHADHLYHVFPRELSCWFCNGFVSRRQVQWAGTPRSQLGWSTFGITSSTTLAGQSRECGPTSTWSTTCTNSVCWTTRGVCTSCRIPKYHYRRSAQWLNHSPTCHLRRYHLVMEPPRQERGAKVLCTILPRYRTIQSMPSPRWTVCDSSAPSQRADLIVPSVALRRPPHCPPAHRRCPSHPRPHPPHLPRYHTPAVPLSSSIQL